jgi:hypothetical protein
MIYTDNSYCEFEEGEIFSTDYHNEYAVYYSDHIELHTLDSTNQADDDELNIPTIDQCTICRKLRLSKFRYCRSCMKLYNKQWYDIYLDSTDKIGKIHAWEYNKGYAQESLLNKVNLHKAQGDPAYVAIHRIRCIIAFQHLLPNHKLKDPTVMNHTYAAALYMKAATNAGYMHIDISGSQLHIRTDKHDIYLNMFAADIEDSMTYIINRIITE